MIKKLSDIIISFLLIAGTLLVMAGLLMLFVVFTNLFLALFAIIGFVLLWAIAYSYIKDN